MNNKLLDLDKIIDKKTAATKDIRAEIRAKLPNIYLSKESLAKLESFGFGRAEILMSRTPKDFVSTSSEEVLHEFGFLPEFDGAKALKLMTKDYVVKNYSELTDNLGAKIDFNYIFSEDLPRELAEFYAEQLVGYSIDHNRLASYLQQRAIFFLANILMLYGAKPMKVMKKLDADEIKTHATTFKRYGLKYSEIKERIEKCSKTPSEGVVTYIGRYGRVYQSLPIQHIICLNCLANHVYYGLRRKHYCCDRCAMVFRYKIEARREVREEIKAKEIKERIASNDKMAITRADRKRFESNTKKALYEEIAKRFYKNRIITEEEKIKIAKHIDRIYDNFYTSKESPAYTSPDKVIIMYRQQECRRNERKQKQKI